MQIGQTEMVQTIPMLETNTYLKYYIHIVLELIILMYSGTIRFENNRKYTIGSKITNVFRSR